MATLEHLRGDVADLAAAPRWSLSDEERCDCLRAAYRLRETATALLLTMAYETETAGTPAHRGHPDLIGFLRGELRVDPAQARELATQAALVSRWPTVQQALIGGRVDVRQAAVIAAAVDEMPATLAEVDDGTLTDQRPHAEIVQAAQDRLIALAGDFPAYQVRRLSQRILDHVAPEIAERAEELALRRQEERAWGQRGFTLALPQAGLVRVSGALTVEAAATVRAALEPLCGPKTREDRTAAQQRADALIDVCRLALRTGELPDNGGEPPQLALTATVDAVTGTVGIGTLDTGERVSAETVRRLACDAQVASFLLDGVGQILYAGRKRRKATGPLRRAVLVRDGGCAFPDCDSPPRWCSVHHILSWCDGGTSDLPNLVALCSRHHKLIHDESSGWQVRTGADRLPEFLPPAWMDPARTPRRNVFHPRK
ncbi:HNH endonuclease signature motif containing protein [Actinoplanes sp. TFC3]|uniref:HNH endonuclease signature motif containing protein n=1 Tax=Actinoplanes sp. TFC3 TaxID=1710355 RepID=UPI0009EC7523|nr:HNH endonuclease signature motif containing protein [Actinoplanes sp. TFC3]